MITLASDFGSPYPAAMKGVIVSSTDARLVDIGHEFPRHDVRQTAFWLTRILPYFPPAVHLVVVDPGVGTDRSVLIVEADEHVLVGPDNGVLVPPANALASDPVFYAVEYDEPERSTFHGRDVFAPLAVTVHEYGTDRLDTDEKFIRTDEYVDLAIPEAQIGDRRSAGVVVAVDDFGNAITTIPGSFLDGQFDDAIEVNGTRVPVKMTYDLVDRGDLLVTVGSHGNVELAVNRGRADNAFDVRAGDEIALELV